MGIYIYTYFVRPIELQRIGDSDAIVLVEDDGTDVRVRSVGAREGRV